ncbi:hypothetical protein GCM10027443_24160 [Pontibacter brevis]
MFACSQETNRDVNEEINEAQMEAPDRSAEVNYDAGNRDIEEFEAWVQDKSSRAETATKEEWAETRAEFRRREAEMEAKSANWDDKAKREWEKLKADWNEVENKARQRLGEIEDIDVNVDVERRNN